MVEKTLENLLVDQVINRKIEDKDDIENDKISTGDTGYFLCTLNAEELPILWEIRLSTSKELSTGWVQFSEDRTEAVVEFSIDKDRGKVRVSEPEVISMSINQETKELRKYLS